MLSNTCHMLSGNFHMLSKECITMICCVRNLICCAKLDNIWIAMYFSDGVNVCLLLCVSRLTSSFYCLAVFFVSNILSGPFCLEIPLFQWFSVLWLAGRTQWLRWPFLRTVALILSCWRLVWSDWIACSALLSWSSRASEIFFRLVTSFSLDEWYLVRGGSSWCMGVLPVPCVVDFARRSRWITMGLWSVGGPDFDLRVRAGLGIT